MPLVIVNEDGEPIAIDYPEYSLDYYDDLPDDYGRDCYYDEPDTTLDGFPYETDLGNEWI